MQKRGLSEVITSLLIILLVFVAIGIVWIIVANILNKGGEDVSITPFTERVKIEQVKLGAATAEVKVTRTSGEENMTALKFVFDNGERTSIYEQPITEFNVLETKVFTLSTGIPNIKKVTILPVFGKTYGTKTDIEASQSTPNNLIDKNKGLIAYYNFENTFNDSSGNGNNGTCTTGTNCPTFTGGQIGNAGNFDGIDDVVQVNNTLIPGSVFINSYSISGWFNVKILNETIIQKRGGVNNDFIVGLWDLNDTYTFGTGCETLTGLNEKVSYMFGNENNCRRWVFSKEKIEPNKYYHFVAIYDKENLKGKLYLNGELQETKSTQLLTSPPTRNLAIGGNSSGTGWTSLNGTIDELLIFNRTLSDAEVKQLYEAQR